MGIKARKMPLRENADGRKDNATIIWNKKKVIEFKSGILSLKGICFGQEEMEKTVAGGEEVVSGQERVKQEENIWTPG